MAVVNFYEPNITLIDKQNAIVTPHTDLPASVTGTTDGDLVPFRSTFRWTHSGIKKSTSGVLTLRCGQDSRFVNLDPIFTDADARTKYLIDVQYNQPGKTGRLFRFELGKPTVDLNDKGMFLVIPLIGIEFRFRENLASSQLRLVSPHDAMDGRVTDYFNHAGVSAPLIFFNVAGDNTLPDTDVLKQNWEPTGPTTTHDLTVDIIQKLANPAVAGGTFQDFYYHFIPSPAATKSINIFAEEFGLNSSGVVMDVIAPTGASVEKEQTIQTDFIKFKNVVILRGENASHALPMDYTRFASDFEHARVSSIYNAGTTYAKGEYSRFDIGSGEIQFFKSLVDSNLGNTPDVSPTEWENLHTTTRFTPWTNNHNMWFSNMADHLIPLTGYVGFMVDMLFTGPDYDRIEATNEFENISFKWVTQVGVNDPSTIATDELFDGQRVIVGPSPTGAFAGQPDKLAQLDGSVSPAVWRFSHAPLFVNNGGPPDDEQDSVLDLQTGSVFKWNGVAWVVGWGLASDFATASPLHPVKTITSITGPTGVAGSAVEFEFDFDASVTTGLVTNRASRWFGFHVLFPFPRQENTPESINVGDVFKYPFVDFSNLDEDRAANDTQWNSGTGTEDLGALRGIACKMRVSARDLTGALINRLYDIPMIWWFVDKFDRVVYTESKIRRNGFWDSIQVDAGPASKMQLFDNRTDELFKMFGWTFPHNFFLRQKEYTGVRFDWRQVKGFGCFWKDAYDENFFFSNAQDVIFDVIAERLEQIGQNLLTAFLGFPQGSAVIDTVKLAVDELRFVKDAYVSSEDVTNTDSRQRLVQAADQFDYLNMKTIAQATAIRDQFYPQFHTLDGYADVDMVLGETFVAQGTRVPGTPKTMVCGEVTFIDDSNGFKMQVMGVNKFLVIP